MSSPTFRPGKGGGNLSLDQMSDLGTEHLGHPPGGLGVCNHLLFRYPSPEGSAREEATKGLRGRYGRVVYRPTCPGAPLELGLRCVHAQV